jgi:hypothetical protein
LREVDGNYDGINGLLFQRNARMKKKQSELDIFQPIYVACREKHYSLALRTLTLKGKVREQFLADPNHAYYVLGDILIRQGKDLKAALAFHQSLKDDLSDFVAMHSLGCACSNLGLIWLGTMWGFFSSVFELNAAKGEMLKNNIEDIGYIKAWAPPVATNVISNNFQVHPEQTRLALSLLDFTLAELTCLPQSKRASKS